MSSVGTLSIFGKNQKQMMGSAKRSGGPGSAPILRRGSGVRSSYERRWKQTPAVQFVESIDSLSPGGTVTTTSSRGVSSDSSAASEDEDETEGGTDSRTYPGLVLLDFGGVMTESPVDALKNLYTGEAAKAELLRNFNAMAWPWEQLEKGEITVEVFCEEWERRFNDDKNMRRWFFDVLPKVMAVHPQMRHLCTYLKHLGFEVGIVSNDFRYGNRRTGRPFLHKKLLPQDLFGRSLVDFIVRSSLEHCRKGDSSCNKIFEVAVFRRSRAYAYFKAQDKPLPVVFFDDLKRNLVGPEAFFGKFREQVRFEPVFVEQGPPDVVKFFQDIFPECVRIPDVTFVKDKKFLTNLPSMSLPGVRGYLEAQLGRYPDSLLHVSQFRFGQSNPTFLLEFEPSSVDEQAIRGRGRRRRSSSLSVPSPPDSDSSSFRNPREFYGSLQCLVLRKQPPGQLLPKAHDMGREFGIIKALFSEKSVPVPVPVLHMARAQQGNALGTEFYVMSYVDGVIFKEPRLEELLNLVCGQRDAKIARKDSFAAAIAGDKFSTTKYMHEDLPKLRRHVYETGVAVLQKIHGVNLEQVKHIVGSGKDFEVRQIKRWGAQYVKADGRNEVMLNLEPQLLSAFEKRPTESGSSSFRKTLVHGDFRLDNMIFDPETLEVRAVLDWELCTCGNGLVDLASLLMAFPATSVGGIASGNDLKPIVYEHPSCAGIPKLERLLRVYDPQLAFGRYRSILALQIFRMASILQGVVTRRRKAGVATGGVFSEMGVGLLAGAAQELVEKNAGISGEKTGENAVFEKGPASKL